MGDVPKAIEAFERSLVLEPSADAHTNVASAYILSTPPNATKAIEHLQVSLGDLLLVHLSCLTVPDGNRKRWR